MNTDNFNIEVAYEDKCNTGEGLYLALKSRKYDNKLDQILIILHSENKFTQYEDVKSFKELIFSENLTEKEVENIKNIFKYTFLSSENPIIKWVEESTFDEFFLLLWKKHELVDLQYQIGDKISKMIDGIKETNKNNFSLLYLWINIEELLSYIISIENTQELINIIASPWLIKKFSSEKIEKIACKSNIMNTAEDLLIFVNLDEIKYKHLNYTTILINSKVINNIYDLKLLLENTKILLNIGISSLIRILKNKNILQNTDDFIIFFNITWFSVKCWAIDIIKLLELYDGTEKDKIIKVLESYWRIKYKKDNKVICIL